jgi:hypothetical protein
MRIFDLMWSHSIFTELLWTSPSSLSCCGQVSLHCVTVGSPSSMAAALKINKELLLLLLHLLAELYQNPITAPGVQKSHQLIVRPPFGRFIQHQESFTL